MRLPHVAPTRDGTSMNPLSRRSQHSVPRDPLSYVSLVPGTHFRSPAAIGFLAPIPTACRFFDATSHTQYKKWDPAAGDVEDGRITICLS